MTKLKMLDLFSGIGGFSLAGRWTGEIETIAFCEIDKFCQKVLNKNFPGIPIFDDIKNLKGDEFGTVDIITGGFPCQPFSVAGKRKGKEDDRHLWPEVSRIIEKAKPKYFIGENVPGIINMELDKVLSDLEDQDYTAETFIIPATSLNAPHKRERVWIIAHSNLQHGQGNCAKRILPGQIEKKNAVKSERSTTGDELWIDTYPDSTRLQGESNNIGSERPELYDKQFMRCGGEWQKNWYEVATEFCRMDARVPNRVDRLKSLGNAIVPQIAYIILQNIVDIERAVG